MGPESAFAARSSRARCGTGTAPPRRGREVAAEEVDTQRVAVALSVKDASTPAVRRQQRVRVRSVGRDGPIGLLLCGLGNRKFVRSRGNGGDAVTAESSHCG
jgi:hypothetical protein